MDRESTPYGPDAMQLVLDGLFKRAPVGLSVFDRELRLIQINQRMAAINGLPVDACLGRRLREILPAVADRVEPIVRSVFNSGQAVEGVEISGETPAEPGRRRHWIAGYLPIRIDGAEVSAVGAVVLEVTARREAEDALRASEARYRDLYLRTPAMMHSIDREGRIVDVSDTWLERMGYERDEVVGRRSVEFLTPQSREYAVNEVLPAYFQTGACTDIAYQMVCKDGSIIDVLLSAVAHRDVDGGFDRSLAVLIDVTERNRAEEALRQSEAQLRQAQKMEAIGRLAGGIAHDFNNLLVVILGNAELMLMEEMEPEQVREAAEQIASAGEQAAALTRQILTFSRQQVVQPRLLDLHATIVELERMLRRLIRADIELVTDLQPALGRVRVDPGQITQLLMNLAVNASDAMPHGGRLVIETANEAGSQVLLTVTDTGAGMDAETQARLFEPFFTTKEPGRGTGLGLATVHGIVRQSGGWISVHSEPGRGSKFFFHLPRVEAADEAADEAGAPGLTAPLLRSATVLVVEDDDMVRRIVADVLRANGYEVLCASEADEAKGLVDAHEGAIDVVLTDVVMPGASAASLVAYVLARHPRARVLYMSGYAPLGPDGTRIASEDFLAKPFTVNALLRKLSAIEAEDG